MTFLEAAIAVLKHEGRPLHFREITKLAIERDLLSHIGKMPEQAMQTRLSTATRRRDPEAALLKVGPGTYSLAGGHAFEAQPLEPAGDAGTSTPAIAAAAVEEPLAPPLSVEEVELEAVDEPGPEPDAQPQEGGDGRPSEEPWRARKRRRRRRRSKGAGAAGGLSTTLAHLIKARGRPIKISELAAAARGRGLVGGDARRAEDVVLSILRTEEALEASRGQRPRFTIEGDQVDLIDRAIGAEALDLEQRVIAGAEQLADRARAQVAAALSTLPLASVAAITRACLAADGRGDSRLVNVVSDAEVRLECGPANGGAALSVAVLRGEGDPTELVARYAAEARQAGRLSSSSLLIVTTGASGAAPSDATAPQVEVWDASELAARMERLGLGYRTTNLALVFYDADFFGRICT